MENNMKISFIGGGNMAGALISGLAGKFTAGANIHVVDLNVDGLARLAQQFGVTTSQQIDTAIAQSDVVVLAVKPQQMKDVVAQLQPHISTQLVLSIAAGIRATDLSRWLGGAWRHRAHHAEYAGADRPRSHRHVRAGWGLGNTA